MPPPTLLTLFVTPMFRRRRRSVSDQVLLPSADPEANFPRKHVIYPDALSWTFSRGSVVWTIWPAVLLHTVFAIGVTSISLSSQISLGIPPLLTTVLGVVIGLVISYRMSSGYERYWMGRVSWSDVIRNSRTICRLIWIHVPLRLDKDTSPEDMDNADVCMNEKQIALDLVEGFAVAVKHHLRGELGIYYEDLYPLVKPLHKHSRQRCLPVDFTRMNPGEAASSDETCPYILTLSLDSDTSHTHKIPNRAPNPSGSCLTTSVSDQPYLLPSSPEHPRRLRVLIELIPFASLVYSLVSAVGPVICRREKSIVDFVVNSDDLTEHSSNSEMHRHFSGSSGRKFRPIVAGGGKNIPLRILHCLSEWFSVLEERNTVPMNALVGMYTCLATFEDSLTAAERVLTTPLPFAYSAQILQCVWLYLFLLPFQLVEEFGWYTVPAVSIAAFFYLGFIAAGEELEQPFGYDENDLDLDLFCRDIIHADIEALRQMPNANILPPPSEPVSDPSITQPPRTFPSVSGRGHRHSTLWQ